jgi:hypothetical protein
MVGRYENHYEEKEDFILLHIYGLKYDATILLEKEDYPHVSTVHWGLMAVGKKGNQKIIPYTVIHRVSTPLGRWLLNVTDADAKVEHKDRNNHNFLRNNIYVVSKTEYRQRFSRTDKHEVCGVCAVRQKKGNITGYKVEYKIPETNEKKWRYFSKRQYNGLENAKKEAIAFRLQLLNGDMQRVA